MRGKVLVTYPATYRYGITPAYAGKRDYSRTRWNSIEDHPRVCGEKGLQQDKVEFHRGSPPRMRGKGCSRSSRVSGKGITPAYAGKSKTLRELAFVHGDHPRVCGEKSVLHMLPRDLSGSPPRMRGKDLLSFCQCRWHRITPAYAGKRLKRSRSTVPPVAIVPLFPSVCNKPVVSDGSPAGRDAPLFLPAENAVPASPAYNLRSL